MTDPNTRARRTASEEEQRIKDIVKREIRETFKNGMPSGPYTSYMWDGMKIVGSGTGGLLYTMWVTKQVPGAQTISTGTTPVPIVFDTRQYPGTPPTGTPYTPDPDQPITVDRDGIYLVTVSARWSDETVGTRWLAIWINGTTAYAAVQGNTKSQTITAVVFVGATQTVEAAVYQTSGGSVDIEAAATETFLQITGPLLTVLT